MTLCLFANCERLLVLNCVFGCLHLHR